MKINYVSAKYTELYFLLISSFLNVAFHLCKYQEKTIKFSSKGKDFVLLMLIASKL